MLYLDYLLLPWLFNVPKIKIFNISLNSKLIIKGDLFIAKPGYNVDGRNYIIDALIRGASAVLVETNNLILDLNITYFNDVPIIYFLNLSKELSFISQRFYPISNKLKLIAITGTNGKSTISHLITQWVFLLGNTGAVMGTIGNGIYGDLCPSINTTESAVEVCKMLYHFSKNKVDIASIEVSSHGLIQNRVLSLPFTAAIFSNITMDHLDYHINMERYIKAKWLLFSKHDINISIINIDDNIGKRWVKKISRVVCVTANRNLRFSKDEYWLKLDSAKYNFNNTIIYFDSFWGKGTFSTKLIGEFNVINILLALATLLWMGYSLTDLISTAKFLKPIIGRMEMFHSINKPTVIIDYAHTPDALKKSLISARLYCKNKLWCIFGCGGNRDKSKRPIMGSIAEQLSDYVVITVDNSRYENPIYIINDIKSGFTNKINKKYFFNRLQAIFSTILYVDNEDLVLIAGKGHENYQIIGNYYIDYSDHSVVKAALKKRYSS
ncbi:UDP-N-acetylmuramoyl-L-alanyl-D-glutamate--2,6-diaminopimelate ligase [Candidatus Purcelliella pentastirinorum]|uniref:UDP-N-acetylmuramoyl-L-alanyl-D-glutamate--2, 6-diaminopimelate ligase n=1 Tax=Candidatus Purcelliella pentastirinorum TaxID=472834 RepID=UPI00237AB691|nr:UDP-N-acetylmuramoyl-L-alanyl-D-glutamate--2,6-diaminopimelate ligase [Candidatus Purcelliella pentastirinorum]WDR80321.1 UDP-N-acetylmuramoyl-L-alanyl-D-glutamate--2,6-diaminopimelate ligase [Candidatus Purcelliella pentastirinorum]